MDGEKGQSGESSDEEPEDKGSRFRRASYKRRVEAAKRWTAAITAIVKQGGNQIGSISETPELRQSLADLRERILGEQEQSERENSGIESGQEDGKQRKKIWPGSVTVQDGRLKEETRLIQETRRKKMEEKEQMLREQLSQAMFEPRVLSSVLNQLKVQSSEEEQSNEKEILKDGIEKSGEKVQCGSEEGSKEIEKVKEEEKKEATNEKNRGTIGEKSEEQTGEVCGENDDEDKISYPERRLVVEKERMEEKSSLKDDGGKEDSDDCSQERVGKGIEEEKKQDDDAGDGERGREKFHSGELQMSSKSTSSSTSSRASSIVIQIDPPTQMVTERGEKKDSSSLREEDEETREEKSGKDAGTNTLQVGSSTSSSKSSDIEKRGRTLGSWM